MHRESQGEIAGSSAKLSARSHPIVFVRGSSCGAPPRGAHRQGSISRAPGWRTVFFDSSFSDHGKYRFSGAKGWNEMSMMMHPPVGGVDAGVARAMQRAEETRLAPQISADEATIITHDVVDEALKNPQARGVSLADNQKALFAEVVALMALAGVNKQQIRDTFRDVCPPPFY